MTAPPTPDRAAARTARAAGLEGGIARLLQTGTYVAIALIAIGVVLMLARGLSPADHAPALDPGRILANLVAQRPEGFLWVGVLVVMLTPAARVVLALVGYARDGEREMVIVSFLILTVIAIGIVLGSAAA
ncbi:MAG: DUF1634 domain-containing protein [Chloroflexi bacterium]|nr:DUF1634 domain-containing protein [Chloroflexota bacterium]